MPRKILELTVAEYYRDYFCTTLVHHSAAWWSDSVYVQEMRAGMLNKTLYRLYLSNGKEKVVSADTILYVEVY